MHILSILLIIYTLWCIVDEIRVHRLTALIPHSLLVFIYDLVDRSIVFQLRWKLYRF